MQIRLRRIRNARGDEEGAILILALIFVTVVALMIGGMLALGNTATGGGIQLTSQRDNIYFLDSAVQGAINSFRNDPTLGASSPCTPVLNFTAPSTPSDLQNAQVKCTSTGTSGSSGSDQPPNALLTLGNTSGHGLCISGNHTLSVDGNVVSDHDVSVSTTNCPGGSGGGSGSATQLRVVGDLTGQVCTGPSHSQPNPIVVTGSYQCASGAPTQGDPGYPLTISALPSTVDPTATCLGSGVVELTPGFYSDAPSYPAQCGGTNVSVLLFAPNLDATTHQASSLGAYYFDFNHSPNWTPTGLTIVAGALPGNHAFDSTVTSSYISGLTTGSKCSTNYPGVQWIFGGATRLTVSTSSTYLEVCGTSPSAAQPQHLALATFPSGSRSTTTVTSPSSAVDSACSTPYPTGTTCTSSGFAPVGATSLVSALSSSGNGTATAALSNANKTASMTLGASSTADGVPNGSTINSVQLSFTHKETTTPNHSMKPSVTLGNFGSQNLTYCTSTCTGETLTFTSSGSNNISWKDLQNITYAVALPSASNSGADVVDQVSLVVSYVPPAFEATSCTASTSCDLINSTVDQSVFFHGTVYAPTALLYLTVHNKVTTIFDRGVIADSVSVNMNASTTQTDSPFQVPSGSPTNRCVEFTATPVGASGPSVSANVCFQDYITNSDGTKTAYPGYIVTTKGWTITRS